VENKDLWLKLLALCEKHEVRWVKVRGHANNANNNRCDELARGAIRAGRHED
jgi:ribonuclease HI